MVESASSLIVRKAGTGAGTIIVGKELCGPECETMSIPYVKDTTVTLQVVPAVDSTFVRWETAAGVVLDNIYYAQPGETVIAVFEKP